MYLPIPKSLVRSLGSMFLCVALSSFFASCGRHSSVENQSVGLLTSSELLATAPQTAVSPATLSIENNQPAVTPTAEFAPISVDQPIESKASAATSTSTKPFASTMPHNNEVATANANKITAQFSYSKVATSRRYHFTKGDSGDDMSNFKLCCVLILITIALFISIVGLYWLFAGLFGIGNVLFAGDLAFGLIGILMFLVGGFLAYYLIKRISGE